MNQNELNEILRKHQLWLDGKEGGVWANLMYANLRGGNLESANLRFARLERANLVDANLKGANLMGVDLWRANFYGRKAIHLDLSRNYILYVLPEVLGGPRFIAGCRNFTYSEAIEHWSTKSNQPEYVKAIKTYMELMK